MKKELEAAVEGLRKCSGVAIAAHVDPDGDAIGSSLGMALLLKRMGKEVFIRWGKGCDLPPQYDFLPGRELASDEPVSTDAFVLLDCGSFKRLGDLTEEARRAPLIINMDHHPDNDRFGTINVLDSTVSSTCELVYEFARTAGIDIDADVALCLYVGIITDTGRFQYSNTTNRTHLIAADLIERGGLDVADIFHKVYERLSFASVKLMSTVISSAVLIPETRLVYSVITRKLVDEMGGKLEEIENLVDSLRATRDAEVVVLARELDDGRYRFSMRSKGVVDVSAIARSFGGGGHRNAAAYITSDELTKSLDGVRTMIDAELQRISSGRRSRGR